MFPFICGFIIPSLEFYAIKHRAINLTEHVELFCIMCFGVLYLDASNYIFSEHCHAYL